MRLYSNLSSKSLSSFDESQTIKKYSNIIRRSTRLSINSNLKKKLKLSKSNLDKQQLNQLTTDKVQMCTITKREVSEALETLTTTSKPVTVEIENLNDPVINNAHQIKLEPNDSTKNFDSILVEKSLLRESNDLVLRSTSLDQLPNYKIHKISSKEVQTQESKDNLRELYFKLHFLNSCGILKDADFDFLIGSLPQYEPKTNSLTNDQSQYSLISKSIVDCIDTTTLQHIFSSPFYSLNLQLDLNSSILFVYIRYLNSSSSQQNEHLIKLLSLNQFNQIAQCKHLSTKSNLISAKLSKHLIELIRQNILNQFKLDTKNLMCISIDTRLLERICFSTFQFYMNEFINECALVLPIFCVLTFRNLLPESQLLINYIVTTNKLIDYLKTSQIDLNLTSIQTDYQYRLNEYFLDQNLPNIIAIFESVYHNYSTILEQVEKVNKNLYMLINTIDYYYITCLLYDLSKFLFDYMLSPPRFHSCDELKMPWYLKGSVLNNLLNQQIDTNLEQNQLASNLNITLNNNKSTIEFDTTQLDYLNQLKDFIEDKVVKFMDFNSAKSTRRLEYSYLTKTENVKISILDVYLSLNQMLNFSLSKIQKINSIYQICIELNENQVKNVLNFYKFNCYTSVDQIKNEFKKFFKNFFKLNADLIESKLNQIKRDTLYELTLMSDNELRMNFIKYVHESYVNKFCSIVSTLASIYLILPSLVDFKQFGECNKEPYRLNCSNQKDNLIQQEINSLEYKSKLINSYNLNVHLNSDLFQNL